MPQNKSDIVISALSGISPVGLNIEQTCTSIRAGIARFAEHAYFECSGVDPEWDEGEPLIASTVASIDPFLDGPERLLEMLIPSLIELIRSAQLRRDDIRATGLFLALPQPDDAIRDWELEETFKSELFRRTGLDTYKMYKVNQSGHTGVFDLIQDAVSMLNAGELEYCIVGGVDSYLTNDRLAFFDQAWRIKSGKCMAGFVPGEAAGLLLLETASNAKAEGREGKVSIVSCGFGDEPKNRGTDQNSDGTGLCNAIEHALLHNGEKANAPWILCDLNGESYRSFEWGVTLTRLNMHFSEVRELSHPADCTGDIGAATGGILVANAVQAFKKGYNPSDEALLWTGSDDGHRAALCLSRCGDQHKKG